MRQTLLLIFILLCHFSFAQQEATLSGRVFDQATDQPLPYATITVQTKDSLNMIAGGIAGEDGSFSLLGIPKGNYQVSVSFTGYEPQTLPLLMGKLNDNFDVGKVYLRPTTQQLDEVRVTAEREIVSSGLNKKTYSTDNQIAQTGGSVLDAMKNLPGISVDQEGKVRIRGSDKVAVLIDGKQSSLTGFGNQKGLSNIPVANIDRIEIINNPSAKYDASGMAGIINIVYKEESKNGLNGEVGFTYGLGRLSKRKEDLPSDLGSYQYNPKYIPSLSLNYRTSKVKASLQSEVMAQKNLPNNEFTTRTYRDGRIIASQVAENRTQTQYIVKGGLDWFLDDHNTLTFSAIFDYESHTDTSQVPYIDMLSEQRNRYWSWRESEVTGFANFRVDYEHKFSQPGHVLSASLQYTRGWEDESYFLNDSSAIRQSKDTTHIIAIEHTIPFLLDYVRPLRHGRLEAGAKLQIRRIPVSYEIGQGTNSIIYPGLGNRSTWGENLYAGYANYIFEQQHFDVEAGLRAEQIGVFYDLSPENIYYAQNDAYHYFRLYPNVRMSFRLNENNALSLFYNRRVDRPGEAELRVFPKYDDPELLKVGNPYLRPQFTQTIEAAYNRDWDGGSVFLSAYYRIINDPFTRIYAEDTTNARYNIINRIYQNVGSATHKGIELLLNQRINDFWKLSGSVNGYINTIRAYQGTVLFPYVRPFSIDRTVNNTWEAKLNNTFSLPGKTEVQLTGLYFAPKNIPQGRQLARSSVDVGIKKIVMQDKGELVLSVTDIFNHFNIRQVIYQEDFDVQYGNYYETQTIRLGFKYKF